MEKEVTDREALAQKVFVFLNSVKHQFPGDDAMLMTIASELVSEIIESETAKAYAKGEVKGFKDGAKLSIETIKEVIEDWKKNDVPFDSITVGLLLIEVGQRLQHKALIGDSHE